jgi:uncharacterized membrane protein
MERFREIDALRGIAIVMMVVFHFMFDLDYFGIYPAELYGGLWLVFQRATITLFLLLVGVSMHMSYSHMKDKRFMGVYKKFSWRSLKLFAVALVITAGTYVYLNGNGFVAFGIIHFISLAVLLGAFFVSFYELNIILGVVAIALGYVVDSITINSPLLLPLGIKYPGFTSVDYVPLFPWFGLVLIGIALGKYFYPNGERRMKVPKLPEQLAFLGRNSLVIYLIHQPILIGILSLFFKV